MAHAAQQNFFETVSRLYPEVLTNAKILEIGALDIGGSIRGFFRDCDYVGVDLEIGKGVDIARPGQMLDFPSASFDAVVSAECFEHNPYWRETLVNMLRMIQA